MRAPVILRLGLLVAAVLAPTEAFAQRTAAEPFAISSVSPAPAGDRFFVLQSADVGGHGTFAAAITSDLAVHPLVLTRVSASGEEGESIAVVSTMWQQHLAVSLGLGQRSKIGFQLPIAYASGDTAGDVDPPSGTAVGDLGTTLRVVVLGGRNRPYRFSVGARGHWPTGDDDLYVSDGAVRGGPELLLSGRAGFVVWAVNVGLLFRRETTFADVTIDDQLTWATGFAVLGLRGRLQLGAELVGAHVVAGDDAFDSATNDLELLVGARYRAGPIVVGPAFGPGLANGIGTPSFRALFGLAFAPQPRRIEPEPPPDDHMPGPEPMPEPVPLADSDGDGIVDPEDACPHVPGVSSERASERGCPPPDRDDDGIVDLVDACPYTPGPPSDDPGRTGCPSDRDFDGILDPDDACPDAKGSLSIEPSKNGCPRPNEPAP